MARNYTRPLGKRKYKKMFILSTEGEVTEPSYFKMFNNDNTVIHIKIVDHKGSSPKKVLREMKRYIKNEGLGENDEAWLVVDKDHWTENQLKELHQWSKKEPNYGLAVSNPMFEYWLLLHFEDGKNITSSRKCIDQLKKHIPDYSKCINPKDIKKHVDDAIKRAEEKDTPQCADWPRQTGTTVYRLVKKLLSTR